MQYTLVAHSNIGLSVSEKKTEKNIFFKIWSLITILIYKSTFNTGKYFANQMLRKKQQRKYSSLGFTEALLRHFPKYCNKDTTHRYCKPLHGKSSGMRFDEKTRKTHVIMYVPSGNNPLGTIGGLLLVIWVNDQRLSFSYGGMCKIIIALGNWLTLYGRISYLNISLLPVFTKLTILELLS